MAGHELELPASQPLSDRKGLPSMKRGSYREFYHCDFDIADDCESIISDAEILLMITETFEALQMDSTIKLNHRKVLDGIFAASDVPEDKIKPTSSAVEKLDKLPWDVVKQDMVEQKGLPESVADQIGQLGRRRGSLAEILSLLKSDAKGSGKETTAPQVGNIAAGGHYDNLAGMYCDRRVPVVGIAFGVERIFTILKGRLSTEEQKRSKLICESDVYVVAAGGSGLSLDRMAVCGQMTMAGAPAAFLRKAKPSLRSQYDAAGHAPLTVILGSDELAEGKVRLKMSIDQEASSGAEGKGEKDRDQLVAREDLVAEVKKALQEISAMVARPTDLQDHMRGHQIELVKAQSAEARLHCEIASISA